MNGVKIILNHFSLEGASCKTKLQAILSKYKMFLKLCMILALAWSRNPPSPPSEGQLGHLCLNCHCLRKPTLKRSLPVSPFSQLIPPCFIVTCEKRQWLLVSFSFEPENPLVWFRDHLWLLAFIYATKTYLPCISLKCLLNIQEVRSKVFSLSYSVSCSLKLTGVIKMLGCGIPDFMAFWFQVKPSWIVN